MDLQRSSITDHFYDFHRGRATNDGVVNEDHTLSLEVRSIGVVLEPHPEMANLVGRFNEGSTHIVIANDAEIKGHIGLFRVANGRWHPGIRDWDNEISFHVAFPRQLRADLLSDVIDVAAFQDAVRSCEVDVFEYAEFLWAFVEGFDAMQAFFIDYYYLTGFYIANESRPDYVQGAGLRGKDCGVTKTAQNKRPDPEGVTYTDQLLLGHSHQRVGALDMAKRICKPVHYSAIFAFCDEMDNSLCVTGGLEQAAALHEVVANGIRVGQVAVVTNCQAAKLELRKQWLHVAKRRVAAGGIANMADCDVALKAVYDRLGIKVIAD